MNVLKEKIISAALDKANPIYIHAMPHHELIIGKRGLVGAETKNGIVLSIGETSASDFLFEETGFSVRLKFAGIWEDVFVPYQSISTVVDNLLKPTFVFNFLNEEEKTITKKPNVKTTAQIIRLDFKNKKNDFNKSRS